MKSLLLVILVVAVMTIAGSFACIVYMRWRFARALRQAQEMIFAAGVHPQQASEAGPTTPTTANRPAMDLFRMIQAQQAQVDLYAAAFREIRSQAGLDEREWKRIEDRVLLITDAAEAQQIADAVSESLPPREQAAIDSDALAEQLSGGSIRERFEQWNLAQPPGRRFDRIAKIDDPLPADAWLAPGWPICSAAVPAVGRLACPLSSGLVRDPSLNRPARLQMRQRGGPPSLIVLI